MTPTPEQVAQWARESSQIMEPENGVHAAMILTHSQLHRLVTRAMQAQAEADAKLSDDETVEGELLAQRIRANAPKVTT